MAYGDKRVGAQFGVARGYLEQLDGLARSLVR
jgi:hypothetical protein